MEELQITVNKIQTAWQKQQGDLQENARRLINTLLQQLGEAVSGGRGEVIYTLESTENVSLNVVTSLLSQLSGIEASVTPLPIGKDTAIGTIRLQIVE